MLACAIPSLRSLLSLHASSFMLQDSFGQDQGVADYLVVLYFTHMVMEAYSYYGSLKCFSFLTISLTILFCI